MKVERYEYEDIWYVEIEDGIVTDEDISLYLDLSLEEYRAILRTCGGYYKMDHNINSTDDEIIFNDSKSVEAAIALLEPYYIMVQLTH